VDPRIAAANPAAAAYAQQVAARQAAAGLPKFSDPRGGGAPPPIPLLSEPHQSGMTMADQATASRAPPPQAPPGGTIFSPEAAAAALAQPRQNGILQNDLLPDQAKQDPSFREGHGSVYAVNQPNLARKYGVIRSGKYIPPQQIDTGASGLKPATVEGLEAIRAFNEKRRSTESGDNVAEREAQEGLAGEAAKLANPSGKGDAKPVTEEQRQQAANLDEFDFNAFREVMMKDLINNEEQRKIVEERLIPLDLSELIVNGAVQQVVPIIPNQYFPTFQSFTGEEELALKRLLMDEKKGLEAPDRYLLDKFQLMTVALGLVKLNTTQMPSHQDKDGNFSDDLFWKKFNRVLKMPFHMLASIGVHYYWFDVRVRKLFAAEKIKNG